MFYAFYGIHSSFSTQGRPNLCSECGLAVFNVHHDLPDPASGWSSMSMFIYWLQNSEITAKLPWCFESIRCRSHISGFVRHQIGKQRLSIWCCMHLMAYALHHLHKNEQTCPQGGPAPDTLSSPRLPFCFVCFFCHNLVFGVIFRGHPPKHLNPNPQKTLKLNQEFGLSHQWSVCQPPYLWFSPYRCFFSSWAWHLPSEPP